MEEKKVTLDVGNLFSSMAKWFIFVIAFIIILGACAWILLYFVITRLSF